MHILYRDYVLFSAVSYQVLWYEATEFLLFLRKFKSFIHGHNISYCDWKFILFSLFVRFFLEQQIKSGNDRVIPYSF
jgi:hypothetical protein